MAIKTSWAAGDVLSAVDLTDTFAAKLASATAATTYAVIPNLAAINVGGTALSGSSSVTVNLSGKNFIAVWVSGASGGVSNWYCSLRINADSGSNYLGSFTGFINTTAYQSSAAQTGYGVSGTNAAADTCTQFYLITGAGGTGPKFVTMSGTPSVAGVGSISSTGSGLYVGTAAVTSVSLISSNGNFDAGTIYVYGA